MTASIRYVLQGPSLLPCPCTSGISLALMAGNSHKHKCDIDTDAPWVGSQKVLQDSGPSLSKFSDLRYLTFMAAVSASKEDEGEIARSWSKACPTLRTIILPKGKVWFERDGKWTCCG